MVSTNVRHASFIRRALAGIALAMALMAAAVPAVHAQQQDIEVTAEVDKTELAVGEEFTLWVKIDGALNPRQPTIPNYDGIRRIAPPGNTEGDVDSERDEWIHLHVSLSVRGDTSGQGND